MSVILMHGRSHGHVRNRSLASPGRLVVDPRRRAMARDGVLVDLPAACMTMALAVAARPRTLIPLEEMVDLLWGHRPDGGPDRADAMLTLQWTMVRTALGALGYATERRNGQGFAAWPIEWVAPAETEAVDIPRFLPRRWAADRPRQARGKAA